jgi:hypothetical protein
MYIAQVALHSNTSIYALVERLQQQFNGNACGQAPHGWRVFLCNGKHDEVCHPAAVSLGMSLHFVPFKGAKNMTA